MRNETLSKSEGKKYSIDDLFDDDRFIAAQLNPDEEAEAYWNEMLEKGRVGRDDYAFACRFVRSVQFRPETISEAELFNLWATIEASNKAAMRKKGKRALAAAALVGAVASLALIAWIMTAAPEGGAGGGALFAGGDGEMGTDVQLLAAGGRVLTLKGRDANIAYNEETITVNELSVKKEAPAHRKAVFHRLLVPPGKRATLTLAEGSRIWVNAGTRVAFPPDFDRKKRELYVEGEIYIEVSPDPERPFIVKTTGMEAEVLGTAFNLSAYGQNREQHIVLVEGSLKVHKLGLGKKEKGTLLSANEMYSLGKGVAKVLTVDVEKYISWKNGLYYYSSERLGTIVEHLSRYYGCSIVCSGEASQMKFSGKLDLKDKLDTILEGISQTAPIAYRRLEEGTYTISIANK